MLATLISKREPTSQSDSTAAPKLYLHLIAGSMIEFQGLSGVVRI
jgi:hypothetical protein